MATLSLPWLPAATAALHRSSVSRHRLAATSLPARRLTCLAMKDLLGDFGGRDPYPAEIATNFGEKGVMGLNDTEHKILIPNLSSLSLSQLPFQTAPAPLPIEDVRRLMNKVVGWRLVESEGSTACLECVWKVRDAECGAELIRRIQRVAEGFGHSPDVRFEEPNMVKAQLRTQSIGCLSINDFILASKIDKINVLDLAPRKRIWA